MRFRSSFSYWRSVLVALALNTVFVTNGQLVAMATPPSTMDWASNECIGINKPCNPGSRPPSPARLLTYADFENGDFQSHGMRPVGNGEPQIAMLPDEPVCRGKFSLKLPLDYYVSANRYRNQLVFGHNLEYGQEYWVGYAFYIPPGIVNPRASIDFHGSQDVHLGEGSRSSSLGLYAGFYDPPDQIHVRIFSSALPVNNVDGKTITDRSVVRRLIELPRGRWIEVVLHFVVTYLQDGFVDVWIDGKKVLSEQNIGTAYNDAKGPYPKIGIYMFEWKNGVPAAGEAYKLVYFDEIRIVEGNSTHDDVVPGCK